MKVPVSTRLDPGLHARLLERSKLEKRSMSNLIEILLEKGLGTVATDGSLNGSTYAVAVNGRVACSREWAHRAGERCQECGVTIPLPSREFKPDFKSGVKL